MPGTKDRCMTDSELVAEVQPLMGVNFDPRWQLEFSDDSSDEEEEKTWSDDEDADLD